jgi:hypothetical protein
MANPIGLAVAQGGQSLAFHRGCGVRDRVKFCGIYGGLIYAGAGSLRVLRFHLPIIH